jgi:hypothetical protein
MPKFEVVLHTKSIFVVEAESRGEALRKCVEGGMKPHRQAIENFEVSQAGMFAYVDMKDSDDTVAV